jgi:hypothetical protein
MIERINAQLADDTEQSVTFAALEARLALERVCYDRLRQRHNYISHADIRGWTPSHVINKILTEVDQNVGQTLTLMMAPASEGASHDDDYIEIGTEVGFDIVAIAKMWNALAHLALHVRLPENVEDKISDYGDKTQIRKKVEAVILELQRLEKGTMIFSGVGPEVSFDCACGQKNKRRANLLKAGQVVSCFRPTCNRSYKISISDDGKCAFEIDVYEIPCGACAEINVAPRRELQKMKFNETRAFSCINCGHKNWVRWLLARADSDGSFETDPSEG